MRAWLSLKFGSALLALRMFFDRRWSRITPIMRSRTPSIAVSIAVAGTLLLWSGSFKSSAEGLKRTMEGLGFELQPGWFDTSTRLALI